MQTKAFILWIIQIVVSGAILFAIQIPLRQRETHIARVLRIIVFWLKPVMILLAALLFVAVDTGFAYQNGDELATLYLILFGDLIASIIDYVIRLILNRSKPRTEKTTGNLIRQAVLFTGCCTLIFLYWFGNASRITVNRHTWTAKGITRPHTFVFMADLHIGSARSPENLKELCRQINEQNPEFVILGGDVTDELTTYEEMVSVYNVLSTIRSPVYFIYGNHDRQPEAGLVGGRTYDDGQLAAAIQHAGIHILKDDYVKAAGGLVLLGREDISAGKERKPYASLNNPYEGQGALIVADHQPYDSGQLEIEKSALQLSGHTHAGQLWPLQWVYRYGLNLPAYGEFEKPATRLYVSAGLSDWRLPFRTEEHCEWELITLAGQ